jgi:hypothetical protein
MASGIPASLSARPVLTARDRTVVELVGHFRQLTAGQVAAALFADQVSKTPLDRTLKRLVERRYLARLARPVGGDGGGSAQYVYQLGRAGWRLLGKPGEYWPFRAVNLHALAVADCFVALTVADRAGDCTLLAFEPEPGCHVTTGGVQLTPDARAEVGYRDQGGQAVVLVGGGPRYRASRDDQGEVRPVLAGLPAVGGRGLPVRRVRGA